MNRVYVLSILNDVGKYDIYRIYDNEEMAENEFRNFGEQIKMPSGRKKDLYRLEEYYVWGKED